MCFHLLVKTNYLILEKGKLSYFPYKHSLLFLVFSHMTFQFSCALPFHQPQEVLHAGIPVPLKKTDKQCVRLEWCSNFDTLMQVQLECHVTHLCKP